MAQEKMNDDDRIRMLNSISDQWITLRNAVTGIKFDEEGEEQIIGVRLQVVYEPIKDQKLDEILLESLCAKLFMGCFDVFSVLLFDAIKKHFPDDSDEVRGVILEDMLSEIVTETITGKPLQTEPKNKKSLFENLQNTEGN